MLYRTENSIHSSAFNFEYASQACASRCNELIESIFESHILPELEAAIAKKIPEGVRIELAKLEINIGHIPERDLAIHLAERIRNSLETALDFDFTAIARTGSAKVSVELQADGKFFIDSLEGFLLKGYFDHSPNSTLVLNSLVQRLIHENKDELVDLIFRNRKNRQAIQRISYQLSKPAFDEILEASDPLNSLWIIEYRKLLMNIKKDRNLNHYSDAEFLRMINFSILNYLLNETGSTFNKTAFSFTILNEFILIFNPEIPQLISTVRNFPGSSPASLILGQTLLQFHTEFGKADHKTNGFQSDQSDPIAKFAQPDSPEWLAALLNQENLPDSRTGKKDFDRLFSDALDHPGNDFIRTISGFLKTGKLNERLATNLSTQQFDRLLAALLPEHYRWIQDFRSMLVNLKSESNFKHRTETELFRQLNLFILNSLGSVGSPGFDSKQFVRLMMAEIDEKLHFDLLSGKLMNRSNGMNSTDEQIRETLAELHEEQKLTLAHLISMLNGGHPDFINFKREFLKTDLLRYLRNADSREILARELNQGALVVVLELFACDESDSLFQVIRTIANPALYPTESDAFAAFRQLVFTSVLYLSEIRIRNFDRQELLIFLMYSAGLNPEEVLQNTVFQEELNRQNLTDYADLPDEWKSGQRFRELHDISLVLNNLASTELNSETTEVFFAVTKRQLVEHFLSTGSLPAAFFRLSRMDVQQAFRELIRKKDPFLRDRFRQSGDSELLIDRLNFLLENQFQAEWKAYLKTIFPEQLIAFEQIVSRFSTLAESAWSEKNLPESVQTGVFIRALARSNGGSLSDLFAFHLIGLLNRLINSVEPGAKILKELLSNPEPNKNQELAEVFEQHFSLLLDTLQAENFELKNTDSALRERVANVAVFYRLDRKLFLNELQKHKSLWPVLFSMFDKFPESGLSSGIRNSLKTEQPQAGGKTALRESTNSDQSRRALETKANALNSDLSGLIFYAQNGFLPWWSRHSDIHELIAALKSNKPDPQLTGKIVLKAMNDGPVFENLAENLPVQLYSSITTLFAAHDELVQAWNNAIRQTAKREQSEVQPMPAKGSGNAIQEMVKQFYFHPDKKTGFVGGNENLQIDRLIAEYAGLSQFFYYRNTSPADWRQAIAEFAVGFVRAQTAKPVGLFHREFLKHLNSSRPEVNWLNLLALVQKSVKSLPKTSGIVFPEGLIPLIRKNATQMSENELSRISGEKSGLETEPGGMILIQNAGLILVWPFLTRLFEHLQFVNAGEFVTPEYRNRAVYVLQYLGFSRIDFPEDQLLLNKILIGMDPAEALFPIDSLSEEEMESTRSLLNGLRSNWEKVKNSSPEGIQETFLQREGVLSLNVENVSLTVEKKGVDVLMESIPWNISLIRLPWMKKPVFVKWL